MGNACACIVVARWENALDKERMNDVFSGKISKETLLDTALTSDKINEKTHYIKASEQ